MPEEYLNNEQKSTSEHDTQHTLVRELVYLSGKILQSAELHNQTMTKMETGIARMDERLKGIEKIIWPVVLAALTGLIAAVFSLMTKN